MGLWYELQMLFGELRAKIDLLTKFHHLAEGIPVKLIQCEQSCRARSQSGDVKYNNPWQTYGTDQDEPDDAEKVT